MEEFGSCSGPRASRRSPDLSSEVLQVHVQAAKSLEFDAPDCLIQRFDDVQRCRDGSPTAFGGGPLWNLPGRRRWSLGKARRSPGYPGV